MNFSVGFILGVFLGYLLFVHIDLPPNRFKMWCEDGGGGVWSWDNELDINLCNGV